MNASPASSAPSRDERWHWRAAVLAPAVVAAPWVLLGRAVEAPQPLPTVAGGLIVLLLTTVLVTDLTRRRIPNFATYTAAGWVLALVVASAVLGDPPGRLSDGEPPAPVFGVPAWPDALAGFAGGFVVMLFLFSVFGGGGGDVKLVAVLGGVLGPQMIFHVLFYAYVVAGAFALAFIVWTVGPLNLLAGIGSRLFPGHVRPSTVSVFGAIRTQVPMAPFLAAGVALALALRD